MLSNLTFSSGHFCYVWRGCDFVLCAHTFLVLLMLCRYFARFSLILSNSIFSSDSFCLSVLFVAQFSLPELRSPRCLVGTVSVLCLFFNFPFKLYLPCVFQSCLVLSPCFVDISSIFYSFLICALKRGLLQRFSFVFSPVCCRFLFLNLCFSSLFC